MTAHLTIHGPDPTDADNSTFTEVAYLYTYDGASSPEDVLPTFDAALKPGETAHNGVEGFVWNILPSPASLGRRQDWRLTDVTAQGMTDGWLYTVNFNGDRYTVTVEQAGVTAGIPVALYAEAEGGLLAAYQAS